MEGMTLMKTLSRLMCVLCGVAVMSPPALAQKVGTTSMQFLHVMPCARGTAMGDAYNVLALGADAVFWNPSGLALAEKQEFSSTYINWIFDTQQGALSYAVPLGSLGAAGIQVQYVDFGEFEETSAQRPYINNPDAPGMTGRTFRPFSYLVGLSYARSLTDKFSFGLTAKYAHESLFNGDMVTAMITSTSSEVVRTWTNDLLFDVGIRYNTGYRSVQVGAALQNFGADARYAKESDLVPLLFRLGIAADVIGPNALLVSEEEGNRVGLAFDIFQPNDYAQQEHVGIEYEFQQTFALRAGYKFNYDSEGLTLGGGIKHSLGSVKISLDYSYGSLGTYLGNVQRISLGAELQ